jgi:hypothetical protein
MDLTNTNSTGIDKPGELTGKIPFFEYLLIFIFVFYAGQANAAVAPLSFGQNPIGAFLPVILCGLLIYRNRVVFESRFFLALFGLFLYFIAISIKYREIHPTFMLTYIYFFFLAYVLIKSLGFRLFKLYEDAHYYLAIVALGFWVLQIGLRGDNFYSMLSRIPGIETFSHVTGEGYSLFLYSVQPVVSSILYSLAIPRNCGYAWEPGAFAVYLCLAIFVNLFINQRDAKSRTRLWVMIIALITTQSTTGYLIFIVIMASYLLRKQLNIIILVLPVTVLVLIAVSSLPFMSQKVIGLIDDTKRIDQLLEDYYGSETAASPQRFTSLLIAIVDFENNPILGIGVQSNEGWTYKMGANISTISGIGNLLAQFGLVGTLFFLIMSIRSSIFLSRYFDYNSIFLLFFIIVFISISYSVLFYPVIMSFWIFEYFSPIDVRLKYKKKRSMTEPALNDGLQVKNDTLEKI